MSAFAVCPRIPKLRVLRISLGLPRRFVHCCLVTTKSLHCAEISANFWLTMTTASLRSEQCVTFSSLLRKGKTMVLDLPLDLHTSPYHAIAEAITKFGSRRYTIQLLNLSESFFFSEDRCLNVCKIPSNNIEVCRLSLSAHLYYSSHTHTHHR